MILIRLCNSATFAGLFAGQIIDSFIQYFLDAMMINYVVQHYQCQGGRRSINWKAQGQTTSFKRKCEVLLLVKRQTVRVSQNLIAVGFMTERNFVGRVTPFCSRSHATNSTIRKFITFISHEKWEDDHVHEFTFAQTEEIVKENIGGMVIEGR